MITGKKPIFYQIDVSDQTKTEENFSPDTTKAEQMLGWKDEVWDIRDVFGCLNRDNKKVMIRRN